MEEYGNYISVALLPLLAILQPHRWKIFISMFGLWWNRWRKDGICAVACRKPPWSARKGNMV